MMTDTSTYEKKYSASIGEDEKLILSHIISILQSIINLLDQFEKRTRNYELLVDILELLEASAIVLEHLINKTDIQQKELFQLIQSTKSEFSVLANSLSKELSEINNRYANLSLDVSNLEKNMHKNYQKFQKEFSNLYNRLENLENIVRGIKYSLSYRTSEESVGY